MVLMMAFVMRSISPPLLRLGPVITPVPSTASLILSCYSVGMLSCKTLEFTLSHDENVKKKRRAFEITPSTSVDFL